MSRRPNAMTGPGPKLEKEQRDAMRKEQYGFANLVKEQEFRSTAQGEAKALNDKIRELTDMLEDRKSANRMLATENARLKKMCGDLQVQLLDKPTARGESAALKSMRELARQFQSREQMTAAAAETLVAELMAQNQAAADEMQRLADDRDGLMAELQTTREALSSATAEVASYRDEVAALAEEKEAVLAAKDEQARAAQQLDEQRLQAIAALEAEVEGLRQQVAERDAAAEAARLAAEAALRSQRAELEAAALMQRRAAVAEAEARVASLQQLLHQAHESLRSLNQTEALGPGWTLMEHGRQEQEQGQEHRRVAAEPAAAQAPPPPPPLPAASPPAAASVAGSRRSRQSSRAGESMAGSNAGSIAGSGLAAGHGSEAGADGAARPVGRSPAGSVAASVQLERSGDLAPEPPSASEAAPEAGIISPARSRAGSVAAASVAGGAAAGRRSVRLSEAAGGGGGAEGGRELAAEPSRGDGLGPPDDGFGPSQGHGGDVDGEPAAAGVAATGKHGGSGGGEGGGGSRAMSVASSVEMERNGEGVSPASRDGRPRRSAAASAAAGEGCSPGGSPRALRSSAAGMRPPATAATSTTAAATTANAASPLIPAAPSGPRGNILELLLHDAAIHPGAMGLPAADLWALLRLSCPGLPGHTHLALATPGSGSGSGSAQLPLLRAIRLHFPDDQRLLTAVAGGAARVALHNLKQAVVGAFGCPRVVVAAPTAAWSAAGGGGGGGGVGAGVGVVGGAGAGGGGVADGTVERVLVVGSRDEYGSPSLDLYCMDEEGRPTRPSQPLSAPWRPQLPDTAPPPRPDEFCIDTQALHRLQSDAARSSGLFDLGALRVFIGRGDGHTYQVWRLADVEARRKASFKALDRVLVEPADDPWVAAAPLAAASLPLTAALSAPTLTRLELGNVRRLLGGKPVVRLYEPSDEVATRTLACRTITGEKLVCTVRITARLARDPEVSEQLLAALQPALQAGAGAPTLPPLHWLSLLGAEELVLARLVRELAEGLAAAGGRIMALPAHDGASAAEVEALGRQAEDAVALKERQLSEGLASCQVVAAAAAAANPHEAALARARMRHIRRHVARSLAEIAAFFRQRLELYRLGAVAWHFITQEAAGGEDPVARLPVTTTRPQAKALADALQALAAALQTLAPTGSTAAELLVAAAAPPPLALLLPPTVAAATAAAPPSAAAALAAAGKDLETALRAAVDAAAVAASEACEDLRRQVAAPGADDVELTEAAQARLATLAAPVTAALVGGMAGLCQAAVAASLAEPETAAALRDQLLAAAAAAAAGPPPPSAAGTTLRLLSGNGSHLVAQLGMQLLVQAEAAAAAAVATAHAGLETPPPPPGPRPPPGQQLVSSTSAAAAAAAAPQLRSALQSLQWLVGALTRAAPAPVAASPHSVGAWVKASVRLRLQLGVLCTAWSAAAVAAAGQALLLCGQRGAAVMLALEVMGREVDRVLDATKATLESLRANRSYDEAVLSDCMPPIATALTSHAAAAVTSCFWLAAQMVMTPLVVHVHTPASATKAWSRRQRLPSPHQPDAQLQQQPAGPPALSLSDAGPSATASSASGLAPDGSGSSGSCYSSSLHVATCASFTVTTMGNVRTGGAAAAVAAAAPPPPARPGESSLAPLSQPLLTTWQPRRSVLYLDIGRLNAAAAAAAAAAASDAAVAVPPPPPAADTSALPHLPAAVELLGWTLRHADEYNDAYFAATAAAAVAAAAAGGGDDAGKAAASAAPSAAPSAATTPRGPASVAGSTAGSGNRRETASVAGSVVAGEEAQPPPTPVAAAAALAVLAADPLAALSEAKMAARMAEDADVAVLAGGRLAEAGSLVKWLSQNGMLVLAAADLQPPPPPLAAAAVADGGGDASAVQELARTLVGLLATHHLQAATVRVLTQPSGGGGSGSGGEASAAPSAAATPRPCVRSAAATPRSSVSGRGPPASSAAAGATPAAAAAPSLQPLAVLTYLPDVALAKPALAACGDLAHRVDLALQALTAAFAASAPLAPHAAMLSRHVSRQLAQQRLMLEGLLMAPQLLRARHPGTAPLPGSVAAAAAAAATAAAAAVAAPWQPWGRVGGDAPTPPALSRQSSVGRLRPVLPAMTPKCGGSRRSSLTGGAGGAAAAAGTVATGTPPRPPAPPPQPPATDAYSTESEDEEVGVKALVAPRAGVGARPGGRAVGPAAGAAAAAVTLLPDVPDADSDAASIASASTMGSLNAQRSRVPR